MRNITNAYGDRKVHGLYAQLSATINEAVFVAPWCWPCPVSVLGLIEPRGDRCGEAQADNTTAITT